MSVIILTLKYSRYVLAETRQVIEMHHLFAVGYAMHFSFDVMG